MELQVRGNGIIITDNLRDFIDQRTSKLDRLVDHVVDAKLELRARHNRSGPDITTAQITIQTGRRLLRAEESDPDARVAVDRAVDKLTRQVRRFHDKRSRKGARPDPLAAIDVAPEPLAALDLADADEDVDVDAEEAMTVVRTKRFPLKPMDVEEAIEQMELLGHDFYLFHNALEEQLNVVYRRRDGAYGLLAPDRA